MKHMKIYSDVDAKEITFTFFRQPVQRITRHRYFYTHDWVPRTGRGSLLFCLIYIFLQRPVLCCWQFQPKACKMTRKFWQPVQPAIPDKIYYPPITYYWTGLLILDHSYLVGNMTISKIAGTKALEPLKS